MLVRLKDVRDPTQDMKLFFLQTLLEWTNASGIFNFNSLTDLLDSCTFFAL